jgi:outer membrane receptor for ferrienterochelin and colicins
LTKLKLRCLVPFCAAISLIAQPAPPADSGGKSAQPDPFSMDLESLLNLQVTTASKFSEKLSDAPGVMSVVTADELRRFGGITLREILERVPGLSGTTASFTDRSMVASRGDQTKINGGHILFLINGRPTREILEGGLTGDLLEAFPVNVLERIEVIKGPGSVLYGSDAFSAVVNLITRKAEQNELTVTGMGSQGDGVATSGEASLRRGNFSLVSAGQFHQRQDWQTPMFSSWFGPQIALIPDRGKGAYLGINYKGLSIMSSYTDYTTAYNEGLPGIARWRRGFADLGYTFKPTAGWDMSFNLTYTRATMDASHSIPYIDRVSNEAVFEWSNAARLGSRDRLTFGGLFNYIQGVEQFYFLGVPSPISQGSRPGGAFYAQLDHQLSDSVKLIGGFQANKIGSLGLDVVPRAGVIWNPTSHFAVKALYSGAFRAPSINETMMDYVPPAAVGGPSLMGSRNIAPEEVATIDVGFTYRSNRVELGLDYFHSRQTNSIILTGDPQIVGQYANFGAFTFQGGEFEAKYYLGRQFFLTGSALYQRNIASSGSESNTPIPTFGGKAGASYQSTGGFTFSLFNIYEGRIPGYSDSINPHTTAYNLLNANVRYDLSRYLPIHSKTGLAVVAHGDNLLNHAVWLPDWKDTPGDTIFANRGRTVYIGLEMSIRQKD